MAIHITLLVKFALLAKYRHQLFTNLGVLTNHIQVRETLFAVNTNLLCIFCGQGFGRSENRAFIEMHQFHGYW
ncbi:Uncharacterised protein [Vibrio cholerae]|nr:Uncharacterised protein [Vibrio cholerae]